jgi:hypothetical protein
MRLSEFWERMRRRFGADYAQSVAADYRLTGLGATVNEALERGDSTKVVWRAVCEEIEAPRH